MAARILLVDDNQRTLQLYSQAIARRVSGAVLDEEPPEVISADSVEEAVDRLRNDSFDIVVVDLKIATADGNQWGGRDVIAESNRLDPLRPVIAITAYGSIDLAKQILTGGGFDFIEKTATALDELVIAIQRALMTRSERIQRYGNPFVPMAGLDPTVFGGRNEELRFFEQKLYRATHRFAVEHFLVLGDWGIGKSTLLREFQRLAQSRRQIACVVPLEPLGPNKTVDDACRSFVECTVRHLHIHSDRLAQVTNWLDTFGISVLGTGVQLRRNVAPRTEFGQSFLEDSLLRIWDSVRDKSEVLVLMIDDLDNVIPVRDLIMKLRQVLSSDPLRNTGILIGLACTPQTWMRITSDEAYYSLARYFVSRVSLTTLSESDTKDTVTKTLSSTGVTFDVEIVDRIWESTQGNPFYMQLLCYRLFDSQMGGRVRAESWDVAFNATLDVLEEAVFWQRLRQLKTNEREVLRAVSRYGGPITAQEVCDTLGRAGRAARPRTISAALDRLLSGKIIDCDPVGRYRSRDRMLEAYLRRG